MKETLEVMVVPTGGMPYRKTLEADEDGSFLPALQDCVGGRIEPMDYVFGDEPAVYCNEEGLLPGSGCSPNRAIYADAAMAEAGYASPDEPGRAVREGELFHIAFGALVCVGFDAETGEDRDIADAECARVMERFGAFGSIASGPLETCAVLTRKGKPSRP